MFYSTRVLLGKKYFLARMTRWRGFMFFFYKELFFFWDMEKNLHNNGIQTDCVFCLEESVWNIQKTAVMASSWISNHWKSITWIHNQLGTTPSLLSSRWPSLFFFSLLFSVGNILKSYMLVYYFLLQIANKKIVCGIKKTLAKYIVVIYEYILWAEDRHGITPKFGV